MKIKNFLLGILGMILVLGLIGNVNAETCTIEDSEVYSSLGANRDTGTFKTKVGDDLVYNISGLTGEIEVRYISLPG